MATVDTVKIEQKPGSPLYWGPMLWRMYHLLAEYPVNKDRFDVWKHILRVTKQIMPCEKCRLHLTTYLESDPVKEDVRTYVWNLHNKVNLQNAAPVFAYEGLVVYAEKEEKERMLEIKKLFTTLQECWLPLSHIINYPNIYNEWRKYIKVLISKIEFP